MKKLILIVALTLSVACGAKEPPNVSPQVHAQYVGDQFIRALTDFQSGVEADFYSGYLSQENTHNVALVLQSTFISIHATPNGAKAIALAGLDDIISKIQTSKLPTELTKFLPYITAARSVIQGLN
jgi:hypothetical protein